MSLSIFGDARVDNKASSSGLVNDRGAGEGISLCGGAGVVHLSQEESLQNSEDSSESLDLSLDFFLEAAGCPELAAWDFLNARAAATAGYVFRCS